jgi:hypothetical protein
MRRLTGDHARRQQVLEGGWKERDDGASIGGWAIDEHALCGFDAWDEAPYDKRPVPEPYNRAFEALYSRDVDDLSMAGRAISNSHVAFTSTRVVAPCACTSRPPTAPSTCASSRSAAKLGPWVPSTAS